MERHPHHPEEQPQRVNSYGTDDPAEQARIEQARAAAFEERQRDRQRFEQYVESGFHPEDAEALIEFEHFLRQQRAQAGESPDDSSGPEP